MANLTVPQLIKLLIGIFVVVVVVLGLFLFFRGTVLDFFKNLIGGEEEVVVGVGDSGEIDGEEETGEEDESSVEREFDYGLEGYERTYRIINPNYVVWEDSDGTTKHFRYDSDHCQEYGGWYWDVDGNGEFGDAEETAIDNRIAICMTQEFVDAVEEIIAAIVEEVGDEEAFLTCEDCGNDGDCSRSECNSISDQLSEFGEECDFIFKLIGENECVTKRTEDELRSCGDCARGTCTERECLRISEESGEFNCRYILRDSFFGENVCESVSSNKPPRVCSDCWKGQFWSPICTEKRCRDISNELEEFGMRCEFNRARWFTRSQCTAINN